jgi:hypothetical protein
MRFVSEGQATDTGKHTKFLSPSFDEKLLRIAKSVENSTRQESPNSGLKLMISFGRVLFDGTVFNVRLDNLLQPYGVISADVEFDLDKLALNNFGGDAIELLIQGIHCLVSHQLEMTGKTAGFQEFLTWNKVNHSKQSLELKQKIEKILKDGPIMGNVIDGK